MHNGMAGNTEKQDREAFLGIREIGKMVNMRD